MLHGKLNSTWTSKRKRRLEVNTIVMEIRTQIQIVLPERMDQISPMFPRNSYNLCSIAVTLNLKRSPITLTSVECSKIFSTRWATSKITSTIGPTCSESKTTRCVSEPVQSWAQVCSNSSNSLWVTPSTKPKTKARQVVPVSIRSKVVVNSHGVSTQTHQFWSRAPEIRPVCLLPGMRKPQASSINSKISSSNSTITTRETLLGQVNSRRMWERQVGSLRLGRTWLCLGSNNKSTSKASTTGTITAEC